MTSWDNIYKAIYVIIRSHDHDHVYCMCTENFQQSDFENERNIFKPEMESTTPGVHSVCNCLQYLLYVVYTTRVENNVFVR